MSNHELLFTTDLAARFNVTTRTVNRWVREGRISPQLTGPGAKGARMFHPAEVERFAATMSEVAS
jgi:DNA-binding transcriptional MerR regulator